METQTQHANTATSTTLIVFVHGNGLTKSCFRETIAGLFALNARNPANGLHCLSVDLPGHGSREDAGEMLDELTTLSQFGALVQQTVQNYLARLHPTITFARKVLVGHSIGCQMSVFAQRALRFDHAVFVEPIGMSFPDGERPPAPEHFLEASRKRRRVFPTFQGAFDALAPRGIYALWTKPSLWDFVFHGGMRPTSSGTEVELCCSPHLEAKIFSLDISEMFPLLPTLGLQSSTVMVGSESVHLPHGCFADIADAMGANLVTIQGASHVIMCEMPTVVSQEIFNTLQANAKL